MNPLPVYREEFRIRHSEADIHGKLKLRAMADYFQEAAAMHAELLGVGVGYLAETGRAWVLSRLKFRIERYPLLGETLSLVTYPSGFDRLFARRQFELRGAGGAIAAVGSSGWLLLDFATLRPLSPETIAGKLPDNSDKTEFFPALGKLPRRPAEPFRSEIVCYSAADVNGHLNNAEYVGKVQDFFADRAEIRELQINFVAETRPEAELLTGGAVTGDEFYFEGTSNSGALHFQAAGRVDVGC